MATTKLKVTGMTCDHCVRAVSGALESQPGVKRVRVDLERGEAEVEHDGSATPTGLETAVASEGYEAEALP